MTEIFYENQLLATILVTLGLVTSQLGTYLIKKGRGQQIYGLDILYQGTIAYSENKRSKVITFFIVFPVIIYVVYELLVRFLGDTSIIYRGYVFVVSGGFSLLITLTISSLLAAFIFFKKGQSLLHYQFNMFLTLLVLGFILAGVYFVVGDLFYRNSFVIVILIGMINLSLTRKVIRKVVSETGEK